MLGLDSDRLGFSGLSFPIRRVGIGVVEMVHGWNLYFLLVQCVRIPFQDFAVKPLLHTGVTLLGIRLVHLPNLLVLLR